MRSTIREELGVRYLREILIGENALLLYQENEKEKDKVDISLRYVEQKTIKDQFLITLPKDRLASGLIEINSTGTAIAMYQEVPEGLKLQRVYSIEDHSFGIPEFLDLEYKKHFSNHELSREFIKKRGSNDGKH